MRSKTTAALLAFFLGGFGIHKFYLGRGGQGFLYLLFCWTFVPACVAFLESLLLLVMSEQDFNLRYNPSVMFTRAAPQQIAQSVSIHVPDMSRAAPAAIGPTVTEQLRQLAELRTAGHLTDEEFVAQKQRLLRS
jgi:TM2 domain-containing membrane protein YozV